MRIRKSAFLKKSILIFFFTCILSGLDGFAHNEGPLSNQFIQNNGQWPAQVRFKTEVSAGNLFFENNRLVYNLWDQSILKKIHAQKGNIDLDKLMMKGHNYHVYFDGQNPKPEISGKEQYEAYHNYFLGNDPNKWAGGVPLFGEITYRNLYTGIHMEVLSQNGQLKYEFEVEAHAQPSQIKLRYEGVDKISVKNEELLLELNLGKVIESKPYCYQIIAGEKIEVIGKYILKGNILSFEMGENYNPDFPLIIDPTLVFSSYSGSRATNFGASATFDSDGHLFTAGTVFGQGYDTTRGAFQTLFKGGTTNGGTDIAISKFDSSGSFLRYSTYLGGSGDEQPQSLIVNEDDELFVYGTTGSINDYPTTVGAYSRSLRNPSTANAVNLPNMGLSFPSGTDIIITRFNKDGTALLGSTYVGGSANDGLNNPIAPYTTRYNYADENRGEIEIDKQNNVIIASNTFSSNFPIVGNTLQTSYGGLQDGVVFKMTPNLTSIIWSTFLGGINTDAAYSVAVMRNNDLMVAGGTRSPSRFGTSTSVFNNVQGNTDGFVTHIKSDGTAIVNTTYFGTGQYDQVYFVELNKQDKVFLLGQTEDLTGKLVKSVSYSVNSGGQFVSQLSTQLDTIIWSTRFGTPTTSGTRARPSLSPTAFLVDLCNAVYISGWGGNTNSLNTNNNTTLMFGMDTTSDGFQKTTDGSDFYMMVLDVNAASLKYASFFGGQADEHVDGGTSRFDRRGKMYQSVCADCGLTNPTRPFPTTTGAHARSKGVGAGCNNSVFKMDFLLPVVIADFKIPQSICLNDTFLVINRSTEYKNTTYQWDFGDGDTSTSKDPKFHVFDSVGTFIVSLVVTDSLSCNYTDTFITLVNVVKPNSSRYPNDTLCIGDTLTVGYFNPPWYSSIWSPGSSLSDSTIHRPVASPTKPTEYLQLLNTGICIDTFRLSLHVDSLVDADYLVDDSVCIPALIKVKNNSILLRNSVYKWDLANLDTSSQLEPSFSITKTGTYRIVFSITDSISCNKEDSLVKIITALKDSTYYLPDTAICLGDTITIGSIQPNQYTYIWSPDSSLDNKNSSQPKAFPWFDSKYELHQIKEVCTDTWRLFVEVDSVLKARFVIPDSVCIPDTVKLINSSTFYQGTSYSWDLSGLGDTLPKDPTIAITAKGVYKIEITIEDTSTCNQKDVLTRFIEGKEDTSFAAPTKLFCNNIPGQIGLLDNPNYTYFWNTSIGLSDSTKSQPFATPPGDAIYILHIAKGVCTDTLYQPVIKDSILAETKDRVDVCTFNPIVDLKVNSSGLANTFQWSNFKNFSDQIPTSKDDSTITVEALGFKNAYYAKTTSSRGCVETDSSLIFITDLGIFVDKSPEKCMYDTVQLRVYSDLPGDTLSAIWSPYQEIVGRNDSTIISVHPKATKTYYVDVVNYLGCRKKDSVPVIVSTLDRDSVRIKATRDTIVDAWDTQLQAFPAGYEYEWTPDEALTSATIFNPTAQPKRTIDYTVRVYDPAYPQCEEKGTKRIYYEEVFCDEPFIYLPNSFSPNGDGKNDKLLIRGKYISSVKLLIYNRWGQKVFESTDQNIGWDGTFEGEVVNPDVFAYYLYVECLGNQIFEKKGDITVIR